MNQELIMEIIKNLITVFFGIMQAVFLMVLVGGVNMYFSVRTLKKSLNAAFSKIRDLEQKVYKE